jgi:hypothetical protein
MVQCVPAPPLVVPDLGLWQGRCDNHRLCQSFFSYNSKAAIPSKEWCINQMGMGKV